MDYQFPDFQTARDIRSKRQGLEAAIRELYTLPIIKEQTLEIRIDGEEKRKAEICINKHQGQLNIEYQNLTGNGTNYNPVAVSGDITITNAGVASLAGNLEIKGWIQFVGTGTIATQDHYNVASITDNGTGDYTVTWDTDFANDDYAAVCSCGSGAYSCSVVAFAVGTTQVNTQDFNSASDAGFVTVIGIGDQ